MKDEASDKTGGGVAEREAQASSRLLLEAPEAAKAPAVFRVKKILVPVDFSACAQAALDFAIPLAAHFGAELTLLYVAPLVPPVPEFGPVDAAALEEGRKQLDELQAQVGAALPTNSVAGVLRKGAPYAEILGAAGERGIDLIVLATHGRTGLARVLRGSTSERVVRYARCPVMVVHQGEPESAEDNTPELAPGD